MADWADDAVTKYGLRWYRMLVGRAPLDDELVHDLIRVADAVTAASTREPG